MLAIDGSNVDQSPSGSRLENANGKCAAGFNGAGRLRLRRPYLLQEWCFIVLEEARSRAGRSLAFTFFRCLLRPRLNEQEVPDMRQVHSDSAVTRIPVPCPYLVEVLFVSSHPYTGYQSQRCTSKSGGMARVSGRGAGI